MSAMHGANMKIIIFLWLRLL